MESSGARSSQCSSLGFKRVRTCVWFVRMEGKGLGIFMIRVRVGCEERKRK